MALPANEMRESVNTIKGRGRGESLRPLPYHKGETGQAR